MKRLLVTLAHPQHAGMWRALRVLADAAPEYGWELRYAVPARHPLIAHAGIPREQVTVVPGLGKWRRWTERARLPLTVVRLCRAARGAEAIYSTTLSTFPHCWYAGRVLGVPQIVHVYSSYGDARPYRKHLLDRARHVIAPSADSLALAARAVGGFGPGVRTRVAYNGMDVARIERDAAAPLALDLGPAGRRIGMVGNLDWRKNPRCLVEATPAIRAAVPDVRVWLVGAFPDAAAEAALRQRIRTLGLEATIGLTGFLPNPFPVVRALDVLVHPALRDPFPLALLEGMALARPIVASAVGGVPEMLIDGESGWLVPPDDPAALAAAVLTLLRDQELRRRLGEGARARLTATFSLAEFARTMFGAFDDAVRDQAA
jgi:glycosyltransferase involved in cell wall biosynthesis